MSELKAEISLPKRLAEDMQAQVKAGWFPDLNSLVVEAVRRYWRLIMVS
jgi:Arc/MetJ-type ribon-helix-helix transcriptional regulator